MSDALNLDYSLLIPEYILGAVAVLVLFVDIMMPKVRKEALAYIAAGGLLLALVVSLGWLDSEDNFARLIYIDDFTTFFRCFFMATSIFIVIASAHFVEKNLRNPGEYYAPIVEMTMSA